MNYLVRLDESGKNGTTPVAGSRKTKERAFRVVPRKLPARETRMPVLTTKGVRPLAMSLGLNGDHKSTEVPYNWSVPMDLQGDQKTVATPKIKNLSPPSRRVDDGGDLGAMSIDPPRQHHHLDHHHSNSPGEVYLKKPIQKNDDGDSSSGIGKTPQPPPRQPSNARQAFAKTARTKTPPGMIRRAPSNRSLWSAGNNSFTSRLSGSRRGGAAFSRQASRSSMASSVSSSYSELKAITKNFKRIGTSSSSTSPPSASGAAAAHNPSKYQATSNVALWASGAMAVGVPYGGGHDDTNSYRKFGRYGDDDEDNAFRPTNPVAHQFLDYDASTLGSAATVGSEA